MAATSSQKSYEPTVMGVAHHSVFAGAVLHRIDRMHLRPRIVGIEAHPGTKNEFWKRVQGELEARGVRVVFLVTSSFDRQFRAHWDKAMAVDPQHVRGVPQAKRIEGMLSALANYSLPNMLIKNALKKKPDLIICGAIHLPILRKGLRVPKNKCITTTRVSKEAWQREIRKVRRFEHERNRRKSARKALIKGRHI